MNPILKERTKIRDKYLIDNKETLLAFAKKYGFYDKDKDEDFVLLEALSRIVALKAVKKKYPTATFTIMPLRHHYDFEVHSPDGAIRYVEAKFRTNDDGLYPTDDISNCKKGYITAITNTDNPIDLYYTHWDGIVRVYDIKKPCDTYGDWNHNQTTARPGKRITEGKLSYCPDSALWTTTITLPDEFV